MKRLSTLLLALLILLIPARAEQRTDGILFYNLNIAKGYAEISGYVAGRIPEELRLPKSLYDNGVLYPVTGIYGGAFESCEELKKVVILSEVDAINDFTFTGCVNLEEIILPESLKTIGLSAFSMCSSLVSVTMPQGLNKIDSRAFNGCSSLAAINLPAELTRIGDYAFDGCASLRSVILPAKLESVGKYVFRECKALRSAELPAVMTAVPEGLFYGCSSLNEIAINGLNRIGDYAFSLSGLESVNFPPTVSQIGASAFASCKNLWSVEFSDGLLTIGNDAFADCEMLEAVSLPSSLTSIGERAFRYSGLKEMAVPAGVTSIGAEAFSSTQLRRLQLPTTITEIPEGMASYCRTLREIEIPASVTTIGADAFYESFLRYVTLGRNVKTIESRAFSNSDMTFYCMATTPPAAKTLSVNPANATLFVPEGSVELYRQAAQWKDFSRILPFTSKEADAVVITQMFDEVIVAVGENVTLSATVYPPSATLPELKWASADPAVATVSGNGVVKGVSVGETTITVTAPSGKSASCVVKVGRHLESITARIGYQEYGGSTATEDRTVTLPANSSGRYEIKVYPNPAEAGMIWFSDPISWEVSDPAVVEVSYSGVVSDSENSCYKAFPLTLKNPGTALLKGRMRSGVETQVSIKVIADADVVEAKSLTVTADRTSVEVGETLQLHAQFDPALTTVQFVNWISPLPEVATVDADGLLTARGWGGIRVLAYSYFPELEDWIELNVTDVNHVDVDRVIPMLNGEDMTDATLQLKVGETAKFEAQVIPANATDQRVLWSSSDAAVATVTDSGMVSAIAPGETSITVRSPENLSESSCRVIVTDPAAIEAVEAETDYAEEIYTVGGVRIDSRCSSLAPGVYVIRRGTEVRKMVVH